MKTRAQIWDFIVITFGIWLVSLSVYFFLVPSKAAIASVSGLAIVLENFLPFSMSTIAMAINVILLILGFILIGKDFGAKTIYTSMMLPFLVGIYEKIFPNLTSLTGDQTVDVLAYCLSVSVGLTILFNRNASSGGLDIVAKIMNKYMHMELGKALGISGMVVALTSAFAYDAKTVVLSVIGTYLNSIILDYFIFGQTLKRRICIISKKQDEILDFILNVLHSGATKYHAYGTYSDKQYVEINVIVNKNEYLKLINFITNVDPDAFVTVYAVNEMMYKPKEIN